MSVEIECLVDSGCELGESPVWDAERNRLLWADILGRRIHALELSSGQVRSWDLPAEVGSFGLCESDLLVVALPDGVYLFDPARGGLELLVDPEPDRPTNRLNDGKVGPDRAFWIGSMDTRPDKRPVAALYRVTAGGQCERKVSGLLTSNGLAWSGDGRTMYHSDSRGSWIDRHDFDPVSGALANRVRIAEPSNEQGRPDGAAVDEEGCYWSCGVSAACLNRFSPDGEIVQRIALPVPAPTMCCFGGDDMKTLFITSLRDGLADDILRQSPLSGSVLIMRMNVVGVRVGRFGS
jgi:sugar lactone lactonase YvrE